MKTFLLFLLLLCAVGCGRTGEPPGLTNGTLAIPPEIVSTSSPPIVWNYIDPWRSLEPKTRRIQIHLNNIEVFDGEIEPIAAEPPVAGFHDTHLAAGSYDLRVRDRTANRTATATFISPYTQQIIVDIEDMKITVNTNRVMYFL